MKNKNIAAVLALLFGSIGMHKAYLNQTSKAMVRIILMLIFFYLDIDLGMKILVLIGIIEGLVLLSMSQDRFDREYQQPEESTGLFTTRKKSKQPGMNAYKRSGIDKYRAFDYQGAIEDFNKSLVQDPNDNATHFNLACAYSLMEDLDKSMYHLNKALENGMSDWDRIRTTEGLAYTRTQPEFETWRAEKTRGKESPKQIEAETGTTDLLEQIRILNEKRDKGELNEEEFFRKEKRFFNQAYPNHWHTDNLENYIFDPANSCKAFNILNGHSAPYLF